MFSNLRGRDGQRTYFNGCSSVSVNGEVVARTAQYSVDEVEVAVAVVDLEEIRSYRNNIRSRTFKAASTPTFPRVNVDFSLSGDREAIPLMSTPSLTWIYHSPEEEIALGPACWLWDYLRRSGQGGYLVPLSGGLDSSSTATLVFSMCSLVVNSIRNGNSKALSDIRRLVADPGYTPTDPKELCNRIFVTLYMGTKNSSEETKNRAALLASQIGSHHMSITIDKAVSAMMEIFSEANPGWEPKFSVHGGSVRENVALQNVQARSRMVVAYLFAQLVLWTRGRPGGLLVLGSANV